MCKRLSRNCLLQFAFVIWQRMLTLSSFFWLVAGGIGVTIVSVDEARAQLRIDAPVEAIADKSEVLRAILEFHTIEAIVDSSPELAPPSDMEAFSYSPSHDSEITIDLTANEFVTFDLGAGSNVAFDGIEEDLLVYEVGDDGNYIVEVGLTLDTLTLIDEFEGHALIDLEQIAGQDVRYLQVTAVSDVVNIAGVRVLNSRGGVRVERVNFDAGREGLSSATGESGSVGTPAIANLDDDPQSEVVVITDLRPNETATYTLATDGATGNTEWDWFGGNRFRPAAIAELRSELMGPEIVLCSADATYLLSSRGELVFDVEHPNGCEFPVIANVDTDPEAEILTGGAYNVFGVREWSLPQLVDVDGDDFERKDLLAVDLTRDGTNEVVFYSSKGFVAAVQSPDTVLWKAEVESDAQLAVADFDGDSLPDIVAATSSGLAVFDAEGRAWSRINIPATIFSPPAIADVDGDDVLDVVVTRRFAGRLYLETYPLGRLYEAGVPQEFDGDSVVLWRRELIDVSNTTTGSGVSLHDLDSDGAWEVVINVFGLGTQVDEGFNVLSGKDGDVLYRNPRINSRTLEESVAIADVDADGFAEFVTTDQEGVWVIGADDLIQGTRDIWHQHTYYVTDVNDDLTVPVREQPSWLAHNTFRTQVEGVETPLPDECECITGNTPQSGSVVFRFDFEDGSLPTETPGIEFYSHEDRLTDAVYSVADGVLRQRTTSLNGSAGYWNSSEEFESPDIESSHRVAFESRFRILDVNNGVGAVNMDWTDGTHLYQLSIFGETPNRVQLHLAGDDDLRSEFFDATDFHTYRIESEPNSEQVFIFIDGELVLAGNGTEFSGENWFSWGDNRTPFEIGADVDWDYVDFRAGAFDDPCVVPRPVFAFDFERGSNNTLVLPALVGVDAARTPSVVLEGVESLGPRSTQHVRAPLDSEHGAIDTQAKMEEVVSQLSFSVMVNGRGDNGNDDPGNGSGNRLLSSFNGTGFGSKEVLFDRVRNRLRFLAGGAESLSTLETTPDLNTGWHQFAVVFDRGSVTFYVDGEQFGRSVFHGVPEIPAQLNNWHLIEDARDISNNDEYYDGGVYDEAILWYQALSVGHVGVLYRDGLVRLQSPGVDPCAPTEKADLVPGRVRVEQAMCPESVSVQARLGNLGYSPVPAGTLTEVSVGSGSDLRVLGTVRTRAVMQPGDFEDVSFLWDAPGVGPRDMTLVVDATDAVEEMNESNNESSLAVRLCEVTCTPDLAVRPKLNKAQLTWNSVEAASYEVFRALSPDGPFESIAKTTSDYSTYLDRNVMSGVTAYYKIQRSPGPVGAENCESEPVAVVVPETRERVRFVPNVVGEKDSAANARILDAVLTVGEVTTASSESVPAGYVISQSPSAGSALPSNAPVDVVLSTGSSITNTAPRIELTASPSAEEGTLTVLSGRVVDPDPDLWSGRVALGDGQEKPFFIGSDGAFVLSHVYPDDGVYTLRVAVDDGVGGDDTVEQSLNVVNVAPQVELELPIAVDRDTVLGGTGGFVDPGADQWRATVDYGDGEGPQSLLLDGTQFTLAHTYSALGTYAVTVVVEDDDGGRGEVSDTVRVLLPSVTVPDVVGDSEEAAGTRITSMGLDVGDITMAESRTVAAGVVLAQRPVAGAVVNEATRVALTVSVGFENDGPNITSLPVTQARENAVYQYDVEATDPDADDTLRYALSAAPRGMTIDASNGLIAWTPDAAQSGDANVTVVVTDRDGLTDGQTYAITVFEDRLVTVPDVVGIESDQAQQRIQSAPLTVGAVDVDESNVDPGLVLSQRPAAGTQVLAGTVVDVVVSIGEGVLSPQCEILTPEAFTEVRTPTAIRARLTGATRGPDAEAPLTWTSRIRQVDDPDGRPLAAGEGVLLNDSIGQFDPTLLSNDTYRIELTYAQGSQRGLCQSQYDVTGNLKLGNFRLEFVDLNIPLAGIPITISRTYDTLDLSQGDFGYGWRLGYPGDVRDGAPEGEPFTVGTRVFVTTPEGERVAFRFEPFAPSLLFPWIVEARFVSEPGNYGTLEAIGNENAFSFSGFFYASFSVPYNPSLYKLTTKEGTAYVIDEYDGIQSITDLNGNELVFDDTGVTHSSGVGIDFSRDAEGRIEEIVDLDGNVISYDYDERGDLRSVTDQVDLVTSFIYYDNSAHYLDEVIDPLGRSAQKTLYDEAGRIEAVIDALGNRREVDYAPGSSEWSTTNARGHTTTLVYDPLGNVLEERDPEGGVTVYAYDDPSNPTLETSVTDANGHTTNSSYDERGNRLTETDPLGHTTTWTYDPVNNEVNSITDALGQVTTFLYDDKGNLRDVENAEGNTAEFSTSDNGLIESVTDFEGNTYEFRYDDSCCGLPSAVVNPDGSEQLFEYNQFGQVTKVTDELGFSQEFVYDDKGRPLEVIDEVGNATITTYDGNDRKTFTDRLGRMTTFAYDDNRRLRRTTNPRGGVTRRAYDTSGNLVTLTDPEDNTTTFEYDKDNRLSRRTDALGHSETYRHDAVGNRIEHVDRNGRKRTFTYDAANRNTEERWHDVSDAVVRRIATVFDEMGRLKAISSPTSQYKMTYTQRGLLKTVDNAGTSGSANVLLSYSYDANGDRTHVGDSSGNAVRIVYDERRREKERHWQANTIDAGWVQYDWNARDERTSIRRSSSSGATTPSVTTETYDIDPRGWVRKLEHVDGSGSVIDGAEYDYDESGHVTLARLRGNAATYRYDEENQLTDGNNSNGAFENERYAYDKNGNRTFSHRHGSSYRTGPGNHLLSDGVFEYTYDNEGNRKTRTNSSTGEHWQYTWDHRNRLVEVQVLEGEGGAIQRSSRNVFDATNRVLRRIVDGATTVTTYDGENAWTDFDESGERLSQYLFGRGEDHIIGRRLWTDDTEWYLSDRLGTIRGISDNAGELVGRLVVDGFGVILEQTDTTNAGDRYGFIGREIDQVSGSYFFRTRYYDPLVGKFLSEDSIGFVGSDENLYRYAGNNPTTFSDPSGTTTLLERSILQIVSKRLVNPALIGASIGATGQLSCRLAQGETLLTIDYAGSEECGLRRYFGHRFFETGL